MKGEMLSQMLVYATIKHVGQVDKSGVPYILHPITVMQMLGTDDEELQCIALGHDLMEDCQVTAEMLAYRGFTPRVIAGITALTRTEGMSYNEYKRRVKANPDAVAIKLCDLQHNMDPTRGYMLPLERRALYRRFFEELVALPR